MWRVFGGDLLCPHIYFPESIIYMSLVEGLTFPIPQCTEPAAPKMPGLELA